MDVKTIRTNGNLTRALPSEDHKSGLLLLLPASEGWRPSQKLPFTVSNATDLQTLDLSEDDPSELIAKLQADKFLGRNPGGQITVAAVSASGGATPAEALKAAVAALQRQMGGSLRQIAIWDGAGVMTPRALSLALQEASDALDEAHTPALMVFAPRVTSPSGLTVGEDAPQRDCQNVMCFAGQDNADITSARTVTLSTTVAGGGGVTTVAEITCIGTALGLISKSPVGQSPAYVRDNPAGVVKPALCTDFPLAELTESDCKALETAKIVTLCTYTGIDGNFLSDSWTLAPATSDYYSAEAVRTVDKAVRTVRTRLLPYIGGQALLEKDRTLRQSTVDALTAAAALDDMERAQEISAFEIYIDPAQNIVGGAPLEVSLKITPTATMREITVKIGF